MYFDLWRSQGHPTQFFQVSIPVTFDPYLLALTFAVGVISLSFLFIIPGFRGISKLYFISRVYISVFILWVIFMGGCGQNWEEAHIRSVTQYRYFSRRIINASIDVKIGLKSVNVTLKTDPIFQSLGADIVERIDFNERLEWTWRQGREGYGPFSGQMQQNYRLAQYMGAPVAVLQIAEYFTIDEESIRWGRSFRTAGWFTWTIIWAALPFWAAANLLSLVVSFYAGLLFIATGIMMLTGNIVWASIRWGTQPLVIPFEDELIQFRLGVSFWLVLGGGLLSTIYGTMIVIADLWFPLAISNFFGLDVVKDGDLFHHENNEEVEEEENSDLEAKKSVRHPHRKTILQRLRPTKRRRKRPISLAQQPLEEHYNENFEEDVFVSSSQGSAQEHMASSSASGTSSASSSRYRENSSTEIYNLESEGKKDKEMFDVTAL